MSSKTNYWSEIIILFSKSSSLKAFLAEGKSRWFSRNLSLSVFLSLMVFSSALYADLNFGNNLTATQLAAYNIPRNPNYEVLVMGIDGIYQPLATKLNILANAAQASSETKEIYTVFDTIDIDRLSEDIDDWVIKNYPNAGSDFLESKYTELFNKHLFTMETREFSLAPVVLFEIEGLQKNEMGELLDRNSISGRVKLEDGSMQLKFEEDDLRFIGNELSTRQSLSAAEFRLIATSSELAAKTEITFGGLKVESSSLQKLLDAAYSGGLLNTATKLEFGTVTSSSSLLELIRPILCK